LAGTKVVARAVKTADRSVARWVQSLAGRLVAWKAPKLVLQTAGRSADEKAAPRVAQKAGERADWTDFHWAGSSAERLVANLVASTAVLSESL